MFKKKEVKKVVKKVVKKKVVEEKVREYPHKFKCLDCSNEYEAVTNNNVTTCSTCNSSNTTRIG